MIKVGIVSDTHGHTDEKLLKFFEGCSQIWHCGDIGTISVIKALETVAPVIAVHGNIDGTETRWNNPLFQSFRVEGVSVLMTHIGGYPGKYTPEAKELIAKYRPNLFLAGHSHILKVIPDNKNNLLFINPGAAGISGFHNVRTAIRLTIDGNTFKDLEVAEWPRK